MTDSLSTIRHSISPDDSTTHAHPGEIYRSDSGDVWELIKMTTPDRCMIRHTPGPAAAAQPCVMTIEHFLATHSASPAHAALQLLLVRTPAPPPDE